MKRATNSVRGVSNTRAAASTCSTRPAFITATRSLIVERFFLVVGDEDERDAQRPPEVFQLDLHLPPQLLVERA